MRFLVIIRDKNTGAVKQAKPFYLEKAMEFFVRYYSPAKSEEILVKETLGSLTTWYRYLTKERCFILA